MLNLNLLGRLNEASTLVSTLKTYLPALDEIDQRLKSSYIEIKDLSTEVERFESQVHFDPAAIEKITTG